MLSEINGIEWIRLMYAYPSGFPMDLLELIRVNEKVCKYIDIPVQHISDRVLKSMRRGTTQKQLKKLLYTLREKVPGIAIRTTLLTGYPDETEEDFNALLNFVKEFSFDRLGVFTYSREEGTAAAQYKDRLPVKEKLLRQKILMDEQRNISSQLNENSLNKVFKVLIDRFENDYYIGRTYKDAPEIDNEVYIDRIKKLTTGKFYNVKIYDYEDFDLFGKTID